MAQLLEQSCHQLATISPLLIIITHCSNSGLSNKCYKFTNGVWEEFASMKKKRLFATGVIYNKKLHVFGGEDGFYELKTTETITLDGEVSYGPKLPAAVSLHAMTAINDTVSILSGGMTNADVISAKTWYYNHDTEVFTSGPDLLMRRRYHGSATIVDKVTKAKIAVVTGGSNDRTPMTELLIDGQWKTGTIQCREQKCFDFLYSALFV